MILVSLDALRDLSWGALFVGAQPNFTKHARLVDESGEVVLLVFLGACPTPCYNLTHK